MKRGNAANRLIDFYVGIPILNLFASFRPKGKHSESPQRIGLLFNPALGDTLLASAAVQDVRSLYPTSRLIIFATSANAAAARLLPEVDQIEILPISRPIASVRILRGCRLDLMLDFTAWQRITALYTLLSGAKYTVGFERTRQYRGRGYDRTVPHQGNCHELENLRRLTRSLGITRCAAPYLRVPHTDLPELVRQSDEFLVFHPWASGAKSWLREWPQENWVALGRELRASGRSFIVTGSPTDEPRCFALVQRLKAEGVQAAVLIGRRGIGEIAAILQNAKALVSVNTGIMHLGAIVGTSTISINGPTSADRWGPVGERVLNVGPPDGSGGFLDLGFEYRGKCHEVMGKISVRDVKLAVDRLLAVHEKSANSVLR